MGNIGGNTQVAHFNESGNRNNWVLRRNANWMGRFPDAKRLVDISMPGTHDSGAEHGSLVSRCQSKCIIHQLRLGIRFLDIRCSILRANPLRFGIFHENFYQNLAFGDVLDHIRDFFREQPKEVVVMRLKTNEHNSHNGTVAQQIAALQYYLNQYPGLFYQGGVPLNQLTLGQIRSKIILLHTHDAQSLPNFYDWDACRVEDEYNLHGQAKAASIRAGFDDFANTQAPHNTLHVTFASSAPCWPRGDTRQNNLYVYGILPLYRAPNPNRGIGVVVFDFPGDELVRNVIELNVECRP